MTEEEMLRLAISQAECPFCDAPLAVSEVPIELVCSCCDRPIGACPERFTACPSCGGASLSSCHCDLCGEQIDGSRKR